MSLPEFNGYPLGCLVPTVFPTGFAQATDVFPVMTGDEIRAELTRRGMVAWGRRETFGDEWVKDQGPFGSCNGWSTSAADEKTRFLRGGAWVKLSGADAYSQMNGGTDNGSTLADGLAVCRDNGIAPEELVRVDQIYTSRISAEAKAARVRFRGFEPYAADTELEFATGLLLGYVGIVAVHVQRGFDTLDSEGCPSSGNGPGNHSVHVDDLALSPSGTLLFDSPNNWKVSWGDRGRCHYKWDRHLRETVKYHRFWLLRSAVDDPKGDNPPKAGG